VSYVKEGSSLKVMDTNDYYPFGMSFIKSNEIAVYDPLSVPYNYKYNGKELQETGMYDYGARMYMPDIGRWGTMDGKGELYLSKSPYSYANNTPVNAIDPDGNLVIFINGQHGGSGASPDYWRSSKPTGYMTLAGGSPFAVYARFDQSVMRQLNDNNPKYVDGAMGGWNNTAWESDYSKSNVFSSNRITSGFDQGKKDAAEIIKNLARDETTGAIVETIKIITHSMGGAYGNGYVKALKEYISTLPKDQQKQIKITLVADFDPFQAGSFEANSNTKTQQFTHASFWDVTGDLANEMEKGAEQVPPAKGDSGSHFITSFFNDISNLQEGTYKWNGSKFICTNCAH